MPLLSASDGFGMDVFSPEANDIAKDRDHNYEQNDANPNNFHIQFRFFSLIYHDSHVTPRAQTMRELIPPTVVTAGLAFHTHKANTAMRTPIVRVRDNSTATTAGVLYGTSVVWSFLMAGHARIAQRSSQNAPKLAGTRPGASTPTVLLAKDFPTTWTGTFRRTTTERTPH